ncbi:MAG: plasmid pRiA4b ORF-3 family protein [Chloroflexi bacterium]|nr:plasmid pRiA4b ORF-3 family protein [Chloroflexota bacterium]
MPPQSHTRIGDVYQLKVTLEEIEPPVWRQLEVSGDITLSKLHSVIQLAMGWLDYHLHEFRMGDVTYGEPDPEFDDDREVKDDRRARLSRSVSGVGEEFIYLYDFGDGWTHRVVVEDIRPREPRIRYPRVLAGARACSPEDVGGPDGYVDFLEAIVDPKHPEHDAMLEWVGGEFDPEAFDVDAKNREFDIVF